MLHSAPVSCSGNVENVRKLLEHPAFDMKNPNKVYSLIGGFASSAVNFHAADGSGYEFLAEQVLKLDKINAQVASRMVSPFTRYRRYDEGRQSKAKVRPPLASGSETRTQPSGISAYSSAAF